MNKTSTVTKKQIEQAEKELWNFSYPLVASGYYVNDARGRTVCEAPNKDVAMAIATVMNLSHEQAEA